MNIDIIRNRYHNISEEKKQKLKKYQKSYREVNKSKKSKFNKKYTTITDF